MTTLKQLLEIFPSIQVDFLKGICEAYRDEELDIEQLVEVVLSFEFPPPKEDTFNHKELTGNLELANGNAKSITVNMCSPAAINGLLKEDNVLVGSSTTGQKESSYLGTVNVLGEPPKLQKAVDLTSLNGAKVLVEDDNTNSSLVTKQVAALTKTSGTIEACLITTEECRKQEAVIGEEVSPEYYIRFLYFDYNECIDCDVLSGSPNQPFQKNYNLTSKNHSTIASEEFFENALVSFEDKIDSSQINSNIATVSTAGSCSNTGMEISDISSTMINNSSSNAEIEEFYTSRNIEGVQRNAERVVDEKSSYQNKKNTQTPKLRKLLNSDDNQSRRTFRSCKVKSEEQRLRKKLIHQSRIFLRKKCANRNNIILQNSSQFDSADERYALVQKILPDADHDFLFAQVQEMSSQEDILTFISNCLDKQEYPRSTQSLEETPKIMDGFDCSIEGFLQEIPDPVVEFSNTNYIRTGYEENAEIFLQSRYPQLSEEVLKEMLLTNKYNLTVICKQIEDEGHHPTPNCLEHVPLHHSASVFFHQEVWFIEHRQEIQEYLDSAVEAARVEEELNRPPPPPPVDEVFECGICSEEIIEYTELGTCDGPSGHLFCKTCIKRNTEVKLGEGATTFPCLANCGGLIPIQTIKEVLPTQMFEKLMEKIQEAEILAANIPGVETCPFCPYAYGPGEDQLFICLNPTCMKQSCRACRKEDHSPEICEMFRNENEEAARHYVEDRMTDALVRECYNCGKKFVKEHGCNKMTCTCGAKMCYLCRQPVVDYSHFNGQGGDHLDRCELFSEDVNIHVRPIAATAQQAFNDLIANNPGLNLDPNKIIPK